ncbi:unnamed protein product [Pocillopora meandrina]|uniref:Uncharacterized protein n=1 Tax=Pocillopora meandrina TaxID=46732 RepID=A0AAU9XQQ1_9CNID|nr:unnamed protein product [Pocillopora meandrina]
MSVVFGGSEASPAHMKLGEVSDEALDLFTVPPTNITYTGYCIVEINPTSRMLIPGVDLKMRFTLNDPKFFMNGLTSVTTNVGLQQGDLKMKFFACIVKVRSDMYNHWKKI